MLISNKYQYEKPQWALELCLLMNLLSKLVHVLAGTFIKYIKQALNQFVDACLGVPLCPAPLNHIIPLNISRETLLQKRCQGNIRRHTDHLHGYQQGGFAFDPDKLDEARRETFGVLVISRVGLLWFESVVKDGFFFRSLLLCISCKIMQEPPVWLSASDWLLW